MSLRLRMLCMARRAPEILGDSTRLVREFFQGQQNPDGGFKDRAGNSDLYYTVFGMESLAVLGASGHGRELAQFLARFGTGEGLDFVHLCCLARCWANRDPLPPEEPRGLLADRIHAYRCVDGGFHAEANHSSGTAYGAFLALAAFQDLRIPLPDAARLAQSLLDLALPGGGWPNARGVPGASTNSTAAAIIVLSELETAIPDPTADWLLRQQHSGGGFLALPGAPMPDLLSTATALHALARLGTVLGDNVREACLDFIDSLWTNSGAFHGNWADDRVDCEYTAYGLLALGHLANDDLQSPGGREE